MRPFRLLSIILFFCGLILVWLYDKPILVLPVCIIFISLVGFMSFYLRAQYFVRSKSKTTTNNVLLTFDDGPDATHTSQILDVLKKHDVTAMFFLIGHKINGNEKLLQRMVQEDHLLGSHSFQHRPSIGWMSTVAVTEEIKKGHNALSAIIPNTGQYYRPPFGITNPNIARAMKRLNLACIGWTVRSFDTKADDEIALLNKLTSRIKGTDIVLMHDTQYITLQILEPLILSLKAKGLTLKAEL